MTEHEFTARLRVEAMDHIDAETDEIVDLLNAEVNGDTEVTYVYASGDEIHVTAVGGDASGKTDLLEAILEVFGSGVIIGIESTSAEMDE